MSTRNDSRSFAAVPRGRHSRYDPPSRPSSSISACSWEEHVWGDQIESPSIVVDAGDIWSVRNHSHPAMRRDAQKRKNLYKTIPLPPQVQHPQLQNQNQNYHPQPTKFVFYPLLAYDPLRPRLRFDMSIPPVEPHPGCFDEPATFPSLPSLAIIIPSVPWVFVVHPSLVPFVTVGDVLNSLWTMLQTPLDPESAGNRARRIDLLGNKRWFMGLSARTTGEETFTLHVA